MSQYGDVKTITEDQWSRSYRYPVSNGVRLVAIILQKHIPSHMHIVGNRILITYEGKRSHVMGVTTLVTNTRIVRSRYARIKG